MKKPTRSSGPSWTTIAVDCLNLGAEASLVVPLRLARLAGGGEQGCTEARLMVTEKVEAYGRLAAALAEGKYGASVQGMVGGSVRHYLRYVRANRVRLSKGYFRGG